MDTGATSIVAVFKGRANVRSLRRRPEVVLIGHLRLHRASEALVAECHRCRHERVQWYAPGALQRLLNRGHPVEAHCAHAMNIGGSARKSVRS